MFKWAATVMIAAPHVAHHVVASRIDWNEVVAISTGVLAAFTAWLAWSTRSLARETGEDVRAEFRPVLIDGGQGGLTIAYGANGLGNAIVHVLNVGAGPAINTEAIIRVVQGDECSLSEGVSVGTVGPEKAGGAQVAIFDVRPKMNVPTSLQVEYVYSDLAGRGYRTVLTYDPVFESRIPEATFTINRTDVRTIPKPRLGRRNRAVDSEGDALINPATRTLSA
jgi:hypothetical protein